MRKTEMNEIQITNRNLFVNTLAAAGWQGSNFNKNYDEGLWSSPEASLEFSNQTMTLRCDYICDNPRVILYLDSREGKSLGLVFSYEDHLDPLLKAIVKIQNSIRSDNIKEACKELLDACPKMFKISSSGDKLIPVKQRKQ